MFMLHLPTSIPKLERKITETVAPVTKDTLATAW
jgi:hypothetical protein